MNSPNSQLAQNVSSPQVVTDIVHLNTQQKLDPYRGDYDTFEKTRMDRLKNQLRVR
jgi:ATPase subunit of ABC transporter with duplicated ATPase domains